VFPEFAGLQARMWGKRVLSKQTDPVYGIHQFWTPMGYGVGLYQFQGSIDYGTWLTPTSNLQLTLPTLDTDLGNYTLDEFGNSINNSSGLGDMNTCLLSFINGSTDHSSCLVPPTGAGPTNDNNGGPAGQGKHCRYQYVGTAMDIIGFQVTNQQVGSLTNTVPISDTDNCKAPAFGLNPPCVPYPPLPAPLTAIPGITSWNSVTPNGSLSATTSANTNVTFVVPATLSQCDCHTVIAQGNSVSDTIMTVNFGQLGTSVPPDSITILATLNGQTTEIAVSSGYNPATKTYANVNLQASNFLTLLPPVPNGNNGYTQTGSLTASQFKIYQRRRVCA
jgi:hypothetical protein